MQIGQTVPSIILPAIDGTTFNSDTLKGKRYLITFFRFASCPFCNMRMAQLISNKAKMSDDFEIVGIFESEIEHLKQQSNDHVAKITVLADVERQYYSMFGVKKSVLGMVKGMLFRMPTLMKGLVRGYFPKEISSRMLIMPLSILVDEQGVIQTIYSGKDEGDHIPLKEVIAFSNQ